MGFANPWGTVALIAVGALIALHLWDRRRRTMEVSSLVIWRRLPAAPLERRRRVRPDLLLVARVAAALALVASLVRPWIAGPAVAIAVPARIVVLDASAGMQTRERTGTRFELARSRAAGFVVPGSETMLVAAALRPRVVVGWTTDVALVRRRLETLEPLDVATDLAAALALAVAEARVRPGTRVAVLTDESPAAVALAADDRAMVDWVQLGRTDDNAGITAIGVEVPPFSPLVDVTATVVVRNFAHAPRSVRLTARVGDAPWAERTLALEARGVATTQLRSPPRSGVLTVTLAGGDALALDDVARAFVPVSQSLDVLVVSDGGNLATVLSGLARGMPGARVVVTSPPGAGDAGPGGGRVVVYDGVVPATPPSAPALYVAPPPGNAFCPTAARVREAAVVDWEPAHPVLAGLDDLAALAVAGASALGEIPWGATVAHAASEERAFPFLVAGERGGRRTACLAAGPALPAVSTDELPLLLLTLGTLRWLQDDAAAAPIVVRTGEVAPLPGAAGAPVSSAGLRIAGEPAVLVAERTGVFRVGAAPTERLVLANLLDARESDVGRDGGGEWPATVPPAAVLASVSLHEIGWWFTVVAAALLALEWALWLGRRS